jgi:hypothetical protein
MINGTQFITALGAEGNTALFFDIRSFILIYLTRC